MRRFWWVLCVAFGIVWPVCAVTVLQEGAPNAPGARLPGGSFFGTFVLLDDSKEAQSGLETTVTEIPVPEGEGIYLGWVVLLEPPGGDGDSTSPWSDIVEFVKQTGVYKAVLNSSVTPIGYDTAHPETVRGFH